MTEDEDRQDRPSRPLGTPASYTGWVGLAFIVLIVVAIVNGTRTEETGILGVDGPERGWELPPFAAPLVSSNLEGDANIAEDEACEIDLEGAVRVCDLFDKPLVISFWFTRQADCVARQDTLERVAADYEGRVNFLSVNIRDDREKVREIAEDRGWSIPVVHDRDGAVSNVYGVGGCPTLAYAFAGGVLMEGRIGTEELSETRIRDRLRALVRGSEQRAKREA